MKKLPLIILLIVFGMAGCDSINFDDAINEDDDAVTKPNTESLMAGAMNEFFVSGGNTPTLWIQYQSAYVYTSTSRYGVGSRSWASWYTDILNGFDDIVDVMSGSNPGPINSSFGAAVNQIGVSKIFAAFMWKRVTDSFGPVPYAKALTDSVIKPAYTDQEAIYKDLVATVQAARDMLDPSLRGPTGDIVYGGDVANWQKFANSFLMSLAIQMSQVYPNAGEYAAQVFNEALNHPAGVIDEVAEEMWYNHSTTSGVQNPYSRSRRPDYSLSEAFIDALNGRAVSTGSTSSPAFSSDTYDARLKVYAIRFDKPGRPYGVINDNGPKDINFAAMSLEVSDAASPLHYMTASYTYLNRAEAAALGWTSEDALAMLEKSIIISFESLDEYYIGDGIGDADFDLASKGPAFAAARVADVSAAPGGVLQVIREEKWISLYPRGFQAWSEWRRTGIPGLEPAPDAVNADGQIPRRYIYPDDESGSNVKAYKEGVSMLSPAEDSYKAHFWWDVK